MKNAWRIISSLMIFALVGVIVLKPVKEPSPAPGLRSANGTVLGDNVPPPPESGEVLVSKPVFPSISHAMRDLPPNDFEPNLNREINPRHNPNLLEEDFDGRGTWNRETIPTDSLIQYSQNNSIRTPSLLFNYEGIGNLAAVSPPDVVGDIGPNHYVQMVNIQFAVYDKTGNILSGPTSFNQLFSGAGGNCETQNAGDPIPVYDPLADRWLLSQFAFPSHLCIAISQSPDPTGSYYLYEFNVGSFPDYFKFGVWPDGYYMSANETSYTAYAFDRTSMLTGSAATYQKFTGQSNFLLPSDIDGSSAPPIGSPNYFYTFKDNIFHGGGGDRIEIFEFSVDWANPGNSTFTLVDNIHLAAFTYTACGFFNFNCIRQPDTIQRFDSLGEWPLFRFPYRNFGSYETLVGVFGVGGGTGEVGSALRWFEIRKTGSNWSLYQEGTQDPGDGHDRFNGSIAMDGSGNIALGFGVSSTSLYPSIHYATRLNDDPLGTLQMEAILITGGGSQTGNNRWGDYAAMSVDPVDDCTFWHANEYYETSSSSGWKTRIGVFKIPGCGVPNFDFGPDSGQTTTPNSSVTHTFTITNLGVSDSYTLTVEGRAWTTTLLTNSPTSVAAGVSEQVEVNVDVPLTLGTDVFTITAQSVISPTLVKTAIGTTSVNEKPGVEISVPKQVEIGTPGSFVTHTYVITNTGILTDSFDLSVGGNNWETIPPQKSGDLDPGESETFNVVVHIPIAPVIRSIIASDSFTLMATSRLDTDVRAVTTGETLADVDVSVDIDSPIQSQSGAPGETVPYLFEITNTGNYTDSFGLVISSTWTVNLNAENTGALGSGESYLLSLSVIIPDHAIEGEGDIALLTVVSGLDDSVWVTGKAETTVVLTDFKLYLPVILH